MNHSLIYFTLLMFVSVCGAALAKTQQTQPLLAPVEIQAKGDEAFPVSFKNNSGYIIYKSSAGLAWVQDASELPKNWQGPKHLSSLDWRVINSAQQQLVIAALDSNTSDIHIIRADITSNEFTVLSSLPAQFADNEALCLSTNDYGFGLYSINALGSLTHRVITLSTDAEADEAAQIRPIRSLNVGPNIADCTVIDSTQSLFLVEEELGIWHYDARAEGEDERHLMSFDVAAEFESITSDRVSTVYAASPDLSYILAFDTDTLQKTKIEHPKKLSLATINAAAQGKQVKIGAFDEQKGLFAFSIDGTQQFQSSSRTADDNAATTIKRLIPSAETDAVNRFGDAADDPAIWINKANPADSLIFGTDKKYGLNIYDLAGKLKQTIAVGKINNIDIRHNIMYQGKSVDIAVASNRSYQSMSVFIIRQDDGYTEHIADLPTDLSDVYGLCLYYDNAVNVLINDTNGQFNHYRLLFNNAFLRAEKMASFKVDSQPEGCVVDDARHELFYGEEALGVWKRDLRQPDSAPTLIAKAEGLVQADIEGMGIYRIGSQRYLLVSSQGNNRFAVYAIDASNALVGVFDIGLNKELGIDAVSETDGLEVTHLALGADWPKGLLVVQDGRNVMPLEPQNFKLISGQAVYDFIMSNHNAQ